MTRCQAWWSQSPVNADSLFKLCWRWADFVSSCVAWVPSISVCDTERLWVQVGFLLFENKKKRYSLRCLTVDLPCYVGKDLAHRTHNMWKTDEWPAFHPSQNLLWHGLQLICAFIWLNHHFNSHSKLWGVSILCTLCIIMCVFSSPIRLRGLPSHPPQVDCPPLVSRTVAYRKRTHTDTLTHTYKVWHIYAQKESQRNVELYAQKTVL